MSSMGVPNSSDDSVAATLCLREQQRTGGNAIVKCRCPKCVPAAVKLGEPVTDGEFFCRCGLPEEDNPNVRRCDEVVTEARRLLAADKEWLFGGDESDMEFLRVLWFAVATRWNVEVVGDQWFMVSLGRDRYGEGEQRTHQTFCSFQCDDPFDGICGGYVFMRQVGEDA